MTISHILTFGTGAGAVTAASRTATISVQENPIGTEAGVGDIAFVKIISRTDTESVEVVPPSGWIELIYDPILGSSARQSNVYYKFLTLADNTSHTFSYIDAVARTGGYHCSIFRGVASIGNVYAERATAARNPAIIPDPTHPEFVISSGSAILFGTHHYVSRGFSIDPSVYVGAEDLRPPDNWVASLNNVMYTGWWPDAPLSTRLEVRNGSSLTNNSYMIELIPTSSGASITNIPNMTQGILATITGTGLGGTQGTLEYSTSSEGPWTAHAVNTWSDTEITIIPNLPANGQYYWRVTTNDLEVVTGGPNVVSGVATQYYTDFSEYTTDAAPSDWTQRFDVSAGSYIVRDREGAIGGKVLEISGLSNTVRRLFSWDAIAEDTARTDVEILTRMRVLVNAAADLYAFYRAAGAAGTETGYRNGKGSASNIAKKGSYVSGVYTNIAATTPAEVIVVDTWVWLRVRVTGSDHKWKMWVDGAEEPATWTVETTDSAILTQGWVGLFTFTTGAGSVREVDIFSVGTGGAAAITPSIGSVVDVILDLSSSYTITLDNVTVQIVTSLGVISNYSLSIDSELSAQVRQITFIPTPLVVGQNNVIVEGTGFGD